MTGRTLQNRLDRIEERLKPMESKTCYHVALTNVLPKEQQYCGRCGAEMLFVKVSVPLEDHDISTPEGDLKFFNALSVDERRTMLDTIDAWEAAGNRMEGDVAPSPTASNGRNG